MSDGCTHDCASCGESCESRQAESLLLNPNPMSHIKRVIAVSSGKGGVGKSLVACMLAVLARRGGLNVGVLDADITGPSIPRAFGVHQKAEASEDGIRPVVTQTGIRVMSLNLLLESETDPVVWRGPMIAGAVQQFWTDVVWGDLDVLFIDMPPGTGDVALTVFQSIPVDGVVFALTPQELVSMIVEKAVHMAEMLRVPIVGLVENMSYALCPDCGKRIPLFGESRLEEVGRECGVETLARIPLDARLAKACDKGMIELFSGDWLDELSEKIRA